MNLDVVRCRRTLAQGSKTFDLATRLLAPRERDRVAVFYTWCREVDDAIDGGAVGNERGALLALERRLDGIYGRCSVAEGDLVFRELVRTTGLPRHYPAELLAGMAMDVEGRRYDALDDLLEYAYRVAGTVGLSVCHLLGVAGEAALPHAAQLGIAMQLTNICRDVAEDWERGRLYLPRQLLAAEGLAELPGALGGPLPAEARPGLARVVLRLLAEAERFYFSSRSGLPYLRWDCATAVRAAGSMYRAIGDELRTRGGDVVVGRAVVPSKRKAAIVTASLVEGLVELPVRPRFRPVALRRVVEFPRDVLPHVDHLVRRGGAR
ncbi:phytoene/squalene synthase family protein [Myxococcota bacterium]|nr:phytoene/squalene synthase family protein [Myxococcota bacterium]